MIAKPVMNYYSCVALMYSVTVVLSQRTSMLGFPLRLNEGRNSLFWFSSLLTKYSKSGQMLDLGSVKGLRQWKN